MITDNKLDFWIQNKYNVLITGKKGTGKSSVIIDAFERNGLKWKYFSASTMDPWVDFIGVPKEKVDGDKVYLELIRPKEFSEDLIEAIFFDEFNRSSKKIRNAVLELIQFKSINGKKYNNLKIVWAAINPEEEDGEVYDVEKLDPAQMDRFHIHVNMPNVPCYEYFKGKYGVEMANAAISWWKELPDKDGIKDLVSPRRLDYALDVYNNNGDIGDVLDKKTNVAKLKKVLKNGPAFDKLKKIYDSLDSKVGEDFLIIENNYEDCIQYILKNKDYMKFFIPLMSKEKIAVLLGKNPREGNSLDILNILAEKYYNSEKIKKVYDSVLKVSSWDIVEKMKNLLMNHKKSDSNTDFSKKYNEFIKTNKMSNTNERVNSFCRFVKIVPSAYENVEDLLISLKFYYNIVKSSQKRTLTSGKFENSVWTGNKSIKIDIFKAIDNVLNEYCRLYHINKMEYNKGSWDSRLNVVDDIKWAFGRNGLMSKVEYLDKNCKLNKYDGHMTPYKPVELDLLASHEVV